MNAFARAAVAAAALPVVAAAQILVEQAEPAQFQNLRGSAGNSWPSAVATGDFDADGRVDLLAAVWPDGMLLARQRTDGLFQRWESVAWPASGWPTRDQEARDFDGDGALDVVTLSTSNRQLEIVFGDGRGGFPRLRTVPSAVGVDANLRAGDLDGDGDLDLIWGARDLVVLRNDGAGGFTLEHQAVPLAVWPLANGALLTDFDRDGDLDLFWGVDLLVNDGRGVFHNETLARLPPTMSNTPLAAGDFDGNGTVDVVGGTRVYLQDGNGVFAERALPIAAAQVWDVAALDVDGDGDLDLAVGGVDADATLLMNDGSAHFVEQALYAGDDQEVLAALDVDGDGDRDLLGRMHLFLNVGQPALIDATPASLAARTAQRSARSSVGDVDGDGDLDVVMLEDCRATLYHNDGVSGLHADPSAIPSDCNHLDVDLGDLDGDGDLDLLIGARLYANDGRGRFTSAGSIPLLGGTAAVLHDLDGDGDLDAVVGQGWFRNDGGFVFTEVAAPWRGAVTDFAIGDVDGDGFVDLFAAMDNQNLGGAQDRLFRGDGRGNFVDVTTASLPQVANPTVSSQAADLDGDGDLDLLLGYYENPLIGDDRYETHVYENDGAGRFVDTTLAMFGSIPVGERPLARDLDGDGDLDVLVSGRALQVFERTSAGFVDRSTTWVTREFGTALVAADLDEDGDDDVVLTSAFAPARVATNHLQQLHASHLAGTGRHVFLDAYAGSGTVVAGLIAGRLLAPKVPTPFGRLGVDPASAVALPGLLAAGVGTPVSWTVPVPNDPALVGLTLFGQAVFAGSADPRTWRLSNVVRLRVVE
ncbi:MAG: VCBS repeat-containing protein [Planctomycetota bacterium]